MKKTKDKTKKHYISKLNILSIIAVIILQFRYKFFEDKMNVLNMTYFIDFVKSRKQ